MAVKRKRLSPHRQIVNSARKYYDAMLAAQGGVCGICGREPTPGARRFAIDHDHAEMYIRGVLCTRCNKWLWVFVTVDILKRAIEYLSRGPQWFEKIKKEHNDLDS